MPAGEHKLYCLDARRGEILWDYAAALPIIMEAVVQENRVFFGAMDGIFRALDTTTGKEVWSNRWSSLEDKYTTAPFWPPVIAGNKVIVCKSPAGKEEKNLVAFSAATGSVIWSRRLNAGRLRLVLSPDKDKLYASYSSNRISGLQCLSVEDGSTVWSQAAGVGMNAGIATQDEVLFRDAYSVCCVDALTGNVKWIYHASTGPQGSLYGPGAMAVRDNRVIVGTMDGNVFVLRW